MRRKEERRSDEIATDEDKNGRTWSLRPTDPLRPDWFHGDLPATLYSQAASEQKE